MSNNSPGELAVRTSTGVQPDGAHIAVVTADHTVRIAALGQR